MLSAILILNGAEQTQLHVLNTVCSVSVPCVCGFLGHTDLTDKLARPSGPNQLYNLNVLLESHKKLTVARTLDAVVWRELLF